MGNLVLSREPDLYIGGKDDPYLERWWVIPKNPLFNVYLHCFLRSDDDRALHDHPWLFNASYLLSGDYREITFVSESMRRGTLRREGEWKFRWGRAPHIVQLIGGAEVWTLFITGPKVREWGFYCPKGWIPWQQYSHVDCNENTIGEGCGA